MSTKPSSNTMDVVPDMHHKMSKKIAQLTKVIYHLNTKNEDHTSEMDELKANHAKEIQSIVTDTQAKISKLKELIEIKQAANSSQDELLIKKYEAEKVKAKEDFQNYRLKMQEREQKISNEYQGKFDGLKNEVEKVHGKFADKVNEYEKTIVDLKKNMEDSRKTSQQSIEDLKKKHDSEMTSQHDKLKKEWEAKMNAMKLELSNQYKSEYEKELGQIRATLTGDKQEATLALRRELEAKLQSQKDDFTSKIDKLSSELRLKGEEYDKIVDKMRQMSLDHQRALEELEGKLGSQLGDKDSRMKDLLADIASAKEMISKMNARVTEREEEISRLNQLLTEKNSKILSLEESLAKSQENLKILKDDLNRQHQSGASVESELRQKLRTAESESESLRSEINQMGTQLASSRDEIKKLEKLNQKITDDFNRDVQALRAERDDLLQQLSDVKKASTTANDKASTELAALCQRMQAREEDFLREKVDLETNHRGVLDSLRAKHVAEIEALQADMKKLVDQSLIREGELKTEIEILKGRSSSKLDELEESYRLKLAEVQDKHAGEVSSLNASLKDLSDKLQALIASSNDERSKLQSEVMQAQTQIRSLQTEVESRKREKESLESSAASLKSQIQDLKGDINNLHEDYKQKLRNSSASLLAEWEGKLNDQIHADELALQRAVNDLKRTLGADADQLKKLHEEEVNTLKQMLREEADKSREESTRAERERLRLEELISNDRKKHANDLLDLEKKLDEKLRLQDEEKKNQIDLLKKELAQSLKDKEAELREQHLAQVKELKVNFDLEKSDLRGKAQIELAKALKDLEDVHKQQILANEKKFVELKAKELADKDAFHLSLMNDLKVRFEREMTALKQDMMAMDASLSSMKDEKSNLESQLQRQIVEHKNLMDSSREAREQVQREHDTALRQEKENTERRLIDSSNRHKNEMELLRMEYDDDRAKLSKLLKDIQDSYELLEYKWEHRESRPEDVERIASLERDMIEKDALVAKTREEMLYFKREMLNREENYNQKFNHNPVVGVMQVIKPKAEAAGSQGASKKSASLSVGGSSSLGRSAAGPLLSPASGLPGRR